jgi:hypothetical protein
LPVAPGRGVEPASSSGAAPKYTTPTPRVEVYTMGPGEILFERFGHAALCLRYDEAPKLDQCFNYGTGDFSHPISLGWSFVQGNARFWVATQKLDSMLRFYQRKDRTIWVQKMPFTEEQARIAESRLLSDIKPENKYYTYHHFLDNCTTRVRDIVDQASGGVLLANSGEDMGQTFRGFGRPGFADQGWILLASDFLLGRPADTQNDRWKAMFLPVFLRESIQQQLKVEPVVLYTRQGPPLSTEEHTWRGWVLLLGVLLSAPLWLRERAPRLARVGRGVATVLLTLFGLIIWVMAVVSALPELRWNEVVLVLMPLDFLLLSKRSQSYARLRLAGVGVVMLAMLLGVLKQPLWVPALLVVPVLLPLARTAFAPKPSPKASAKVALAA